MFRICGSPNTFTKRKSALRAEKIAIAQSDHFSSLLLKYGTAPMATSSESLAHKDLRFREIVECMDTTAPFSLHDVGFGLGALYDFLEKNVEDVPFDYSGSEVTYQYVETVAKRLPGRTLLHRNLANPSAAEQFGFEQYDYVVLSGVFHQIRDISVADWEAYIISLLSTSFSMTKKALILNLVSPFVDYRQPGIYYAQLPMILEYVSMKLSRFFTVRHNYALFEFTLAVYTEDYIKSKYPQVEFTKYFKS